MRRAGHPGPHHVARGRGRAVAPADVLPAGPRARAAQIAGALDPVERARAARLDVREVAADDHRLGVALGRLEQAGVRAQGLQPVGAAGLVEQAEQGAARELQRAARGPEPLVRATAALPATGDRGAQVGHGGQPEVGDRGRPAGAAEQRPARLLLRRRADDDGRGARPPAWE